MVQLRPATRPKTATAQRPENVSNGIKVGNSAETNNSTKAHDSAIRTAQMPTKVGNDTEDSNSPKAGGGTQDFDDGQGRPEIESKANQHWWTRLIGDKGKNLQEMDVKDDRQ